MNYRPFAINSQNTEENRAFPSFVCHSEAKNSDPVETVTSIRDLIRTKLLITGAVVLRDFGIGDIQQFREIIKSLSTERLLKYEGGASPRSAIAGGVYTSTEYPPEMPLPLHNELSYSAAFPQMLYFFCEIEPRVGGETTLGDGRRILKAIDPAIVDLFKTKGVMYVRNLVSDSSSPYSWQAAFETDDRDRVENICRKQGSEFEWKNSDGLRVSFAGPATTIHSKTGEEVWFNQGYGFHSGSLQDARRTERPRLESYFGDGSEIPPDVLQHIHGVIHSETVPHKWQKGDLLIVDNILAAHGRMPFSGPRRIVLAMV